MPDFSFSGLSQPQRVQLIQGSTVISVDCCVSQTHKRDSPPTLFELENGSSITDHIIVKPFELELVGIISDTPIGLSTQVLGALAVTTLASAAPGPLGIVGAGVGSALIGALSGSKKPSVAAFGQLLELQASRQPFTVYTSLQTYESMWIKSLSVPRDKDTTGILYFQLSLVQLLLVSPQTVNVSIFQNPALSAGQANSGSQSLLPSGSVFQSGDVAGTTKAHSVAKAVGGG